MAKKRYNYSKRASQLKYEVKKIYRKAGFTEEYAKEQASKDVAKLSKRQLKTKTPKQIASKSAIEFAKARQADERTRQERYEKIRKLKQEAKAEFYGVGELAYNRLREEISNFPTMAEPIIGGWLDKALFYHSEEEIGNAIHESMMQGNSFSREISYNQEALISLTNSFAEALGNMASVEERADLSDSLDSYSEEYL